MNLRVGSRSALLAALSCLLVGCVETKVDVSEHRSRFQLAEEPAGAVGILDLREAFPGDAANVTVVGQIGGVDTPWVDGKAMVVIADPVSLMEADHDEHHCDDPGCHFCNKEEPDMSGLAVVEFATPDGEVLPADVRELFDVDRGDTIVVKGTAKIDAADQLIIAAEGLYVRR